MRKYTANLSKINFLSLLILLSASVPTDALAQKQGGSLVISSDNISFVSQPGGYKMAGMLSYPSGKKKSPGIILIWGSGPHTRDQEISKFPMFRIIADYFNQRGYAVLRIDKRSFGKSEGPDKNSESITTTAELTDDINAALQFLKKQPCVDRDNIGLIGHSEGAWIAESVALKDTAVKWLVLLGAPVINGGERQANLMCANLLRLGAKQQTVDKVRPQIERYIDFVRNGYKDDSVYYSIGTGFLLAHGMAARNITHKFIDQLLDGFKTPWYQSYFSATPGELISRISIPMCFIYGGEDQNVELKTDFVPLQQAIQKSGNKNATVTVLSGLDHFFEEKKGEKWWLSDELLKSVSCWLSGHH